MFLPSIKAPALLKCRGRVVPAVLVLGMFGLSCQSEVQAPSGRDASRSGAFVSGLHPPEGPHGPYFGLIPTDSPELLLPGFVSSHMGEYNGTFSPDGRSFFYTVHPGDKGHVAYTTMDAEGNWSTPAIAPFSTAATEYDPLFAPVGHSPSGERLYFCSEQALSPEDSMPQTRIWYAERDGGRWSPAQVLEGLQGGAYFPSSTTDGRIFYNRWQEGKIFEAVPSDSGYRSKALPECINSRGNVGDPFVAPDASYLIFRAYYPDGKGRGDLYISYADGDRWSNPQNLGALINSASEEWCPAVSPDGRLFVFASRRLLVPYAESDLKAMRQQAKTENNGRFNVYVVSTSFIERLRASAVWE